MRQVPLLDRTALAMRLYERAMGIDERRLLPRNDESVRVRSADVLYYSYKKGFWQMIRGTLQRSRLRSCAGRFFLGADVTILFPRHLSVGRNVAIGDHARMNCLGREGVRLGDNVRIKEFAWIQVTSHLSDPGHGLDVGDNVYIGPHCLIGAAGGIVIQSDVTIGAYVQLLAENHRFECAASPVGEQGVSRRGIRVERGCWLGNAVIVLDGTSIGAGAVIGAGSVVTRDIPPGAVAVGNPARVIRTRRAS